jgi:putative ABC transport system ATP-binding protein
MFKVLNVEKAYRKRQHEVLAFRAEMLHIPRGEYLAVVGPSGSGKTTLLSLLGGMLSPDRGQVWLGSDSLYELSVAQRTRLRRERIGFVFQTFNLIPYLTALENVQAPLFLAQMPAVEQRRRAAELLERLGLGDRLDHKPCELSVGQQQRVALARTLANNPQAILADEPTGNLDPQSRAHVLALFDDFVREGRTIVMVTHDPAAAERAARRVSLDQGQIVGSDAASGGAGRRQVA